MENCEKYLLLQEILIHYRAVILIYKAYYDGITHGSKSMNTRFINPCTWENLDRQMMLLKLGTAIGG